MHPHLLLHLCIIIQFFKQSSRELLVLLSLEVRVLKVFSQHQDSRYTVNLHKLLKGQHKTMLLVLQQR